MGLIGALGLDVKNLIAQLVNFAIIYWILKKFAWDKIVALLEKRQKEITDGIDNARRAEETLVVSDQKKEKILLAAKKEAKELLTQAQAQAEQIKSEALNEAREQAARVLAQSELQLAREKETMLTQVQEQMADLVVMGVERVTGQQVEAKKIDQVYLQEGLK
ncbi:F0F1 ATP synthase subunit B [Microgenomates group bacterium]|nr:F0F1 ATP synthase subunit B [Microgenomates group bacterium]